MTRQADAAKRRGSFKEYVAQLEAEMTPEERKTLDKFRAHYDDAATTLGPDGNLNHVSAAGAIPAPGQDAATASRSGPPQQLEEAVIE